jgi:hypothetical protein
VKPGLVALPWAGLPRMHILAASLEQELAIRRVLDTHASALEDLNRELRKAATATTRRVA